jgi:hypothetical protein
MQIRCGVILLSCLTLCSSALADNVSDAIGVLQSVEAGGKGSVAARGAIQTLVDQGSEKSLIPILRGFQSADLLAANWLRNAFEEVVSAQLAAGNPLPVATLEAFIGDTKESPAARRLAYDILLKQDASIADRLIPGMLLDPGSEFRRDAVSRLLADAAKQTTPEAATPLYHKALSGAVHEDQVKTIAEALRKNGDTVNIQQHFGFVTNWKIVGPFDNKEEKGFAVAYAPENEVSTPEGVNLAAEYDGQLGKVQWQQISTEEDFGIVNIAKQIQNYKGSVMYAATSWTSPKDQSLEIRLGTPNAWKLWVNGKLVFEREEYHRSSRMDQYRMPLSMKEGTNTILLKICQNEQPQEWAQDYQFQVRVCDTTGSGVLPVITTASLKNAEGADR